MIANLNLKSNFSMSTPFIYVESAPISKHLKPEGATTNIRHFWIGRLDGVL